MRVLLEKMMSEGWKENLAAGALSTALLATPANGSSHHLTRGERDHNPTNIHHVKGNWNGEVGDDADGEAKFDTVADGFRAGVKNFLTHRKRNSNLTVEEYLRKFANTATHRQMTYYRENMQKLGMDVNSKISEIDPILFVAAQSKAESSMNISDEIQNKVRRELGL